MDESMCIDDSTDNKSEENNKDFSNFNMVVDLVFTSEEGEPVGSIGDTVSKQESPQKAISDADGHSSSKHCNYSKLSSEELKLNECKHNSNSNQLCQEEQISDYVDSTEEEEDVDEDEKSVSSDFNDDAIISDQDLHKGRKILTAMRRAYPRLSTKKTANTKSSNVVSPCCSSGYEGDHLIYLRVREKKTATFRNRSPQLKERPRLVELFRKICTELKLSLTTTNLAMLLLDLFMDSHDVKLYQLDLAALTALLLAAKFEECDDNIPKIRHLMVFTESDYTTLFFHNMECFMLNFFKWELGFATSSTFAEHFFLRGLQSTDLVEFSTLMELFPRSPAVVAHAKASSTEQSVSTHICRSPKTSPTKVDASQTLALARYYDNLPASTSSYCHACRSNTVCHCNVNTPSTPMVIGSLSVTRGDGFIENSISSPRDHWFNTQNCIPSAVPLISPLKPAITSSLTMIPTTPVGAFHRLGESCGSPKPIPASSLRCLKVHLWHHLNSYISMTMDHVETYSVAASRVAATCLFKARGRLRLVPVWPESLRKYTQYAQQDLEQTAILITGNHGSSCSLPTTPESGYASSGSAAITPAASASIVPHSRHQ